MFPDSAGALMLGGASLAGVPWTEEGVGTAGLLFRDGGGGGAAAFDALSWGLGGGELTALLVSLVVSDTLLARLCDVPV